MQPRSEGNQRCLSFELTVKPDALVMQYRDFLGNTVHHFDIAGKHSRAQHQGAFGWWKSCPSTGAGYEQSPAHGNSSIALVAAGELLGDAIAQRLRAAHSASAATRRRNWQSSEKRSPLEAILEVNRGIHNAFAYVPKSTSVDSPIDHALARA